MSECGRCAARRLDPRLPCGLLLSDRHCAAILDPPDIKPQLSRSPYCPSYQCEHHECRGNTRGLCWFDP